MKVIKPQSLSVLTRPFEYGGSLYCGISLLALVPLGPQRSLLAESGMWQMVAEALGPEAVIDEVIPKHRAEYLVAGSAWPAAGDTVRMMRVRVGIGELEKVLNVFGDRRLIGGDMTEPEPFECMPLAWSRAFGGEGEARNPLGKGSQPGRSSQGVKSYALPNIEYPDGMMVRPGQRPAPAGFGAIDISWRDRQAKAGTYDDAWLKTEYPGFPRDLDWSFFNMASADQQQAEPFRGDEPYVLEGLHPEHAVIRGQLPGIMGRCFVRRRGSTELEEPESRLTTVWFFPDRGHAVLVFHASVRTKQPDASDLSELMIAADNLDAPRPLAHYTKVFARRMDEEKGLFETFRDQDLVPDGLEVVDTVGMTEHTENVRTGQLRRRMAAELAEGQKRIETEMAKFDVPVPEPEPMPDFGFDPNDPRPIPLDELPEIIDRMETYAQTRRERVEKLQVEGKAKLAAAMDEMHKAFPDFEIDQRDVVTGPPKIDARAREQAIRDNLDNMEREGFDIDRIRDGVLSPEMIELMHSAERSSIQGYRASAGYQQPASRDRQAVDLGKRLVDALARGESVDACDFTGADLAGADLSGANLSGVFLESANLAQARLTGANLDQAVLAHADLSQAVLDGASLRQANLGRARLDRASARQANFSESHLVAATLTEAVLDDAVLVDADLRDAVFDGVSLAGADLRAQLLMDQSLRQVNLSRARLDEAIFISTRIDGADFTEASLPGAAFLACSAVAARFVAGNLGNLRVVERCDFSQADFSQATLVESCLRDTRLEKSCFRGADISQSDLSGSSASSADFHHAVAIEARFIQTDLRFADLTGINLMNASLERADLRDASLRGANLFQTDMARVHVSRETDFDLALTDRMRTYPRKFGPEQSG